VSLPRLGVNPGPLHLGAGVSDYDVEEVPSLELTDEELSLVSGGGVYLLGAKVDGVVTVQTHLNRIEL
jgi:hypothetical protein